MRSRRRPPPSDRQMDHHFLGLYLAYLGDGPGDQLPAKAGATPVLQDAPRVVREQPARRSGVYRRLLREAAPYWWGIGGNFVLEILAAPLALLSPLPLKIAVDSAIGDHPLPHPLARLLPHAATGSRTGVLVVAATLLVVIGAVDYTRGLANWMLGTYTGEKLAVRFRAKLFRQVQRLSLMYHDARGTTDSTYRIQQDATAIQTIATDGVTTFATAGVTLAGMLVVTAMIDWQLAVAAVGILPVLMLITWVGRGRVRHRWFEVKANESKAMSVVQEALAAIRVVKAFGREDHEVSRYLKHANLTVRGQLRIAMLEGALWAAIGVTLLVGTGAVLFLGVRAVNAGSLTVGELLIVMAYIASINGPLESMVRKVTELQSALASAERAFAILDQPTDVAERPNARPLRRSAGSVVFDRVSFAYDGRHPVLRDISFELAAGSALGISGTTGAGKTTLVSLLTRSYDPLDGRILLDGVDLRDYKLADLRNQYAIVLQEPVLFSVSVVENIRYARPDASWADVVLAARAAHAHEFILGLEDAYETKLGERGVSLSGGERQRISIARAFLKDAPILILDEPTSSLDLRTERMVMEALERLMAGRTTLLITHRPSVLSTCDSVIQIEDGQIAGGEAHGRKPSARARDGAHAGIPAPG
jgi:ATP-binding cassette subfamily B protein